MADRNERGAGRDYLGHVRDTGGVEFRYGHAEDRGSYEREYYGARQDDRERTLPGFERDDRWRDRRPDGADTYFADGYPAAPGDRDLDHRGERHVHRRSHAGLGPRGYRRSDARITEEVCERLTRHPDLDASDVEVHVADGEVTLEGEVEDRQAKRLAEAIAERAVGVNDVHNRLRVRRGLLARPRSDAADERERDA